MKLNIDLTQGKEHKSLFFISDFHLFHRNVLQFDSRPFMNIEAMHDVLVARWNHTVSTHDIVIYLGDLSFARADERSIVNDLFQLLNGTIYFVMGNHDMYNEIRKLPNVKGVYDYLEIRLRHKNNEVDKSNELQTIESLFCCMHYPIYSWNKMHHGSYLVHGHSHGHLYKEDQGSFYRNRRAIDVGCMLHNYMPISYNQIIERLAHIKVIPFPLKETEI